MEYSGLLLERLEVKFKRSNIVGAEVGGFAVGIFENLDLVRRKRGIDLPSDHGRGEIVAA